jgi:hypothetical protein
MSVNVNGYGIDSLSARQHSYDGIVRNGLVLHLDAATFNTVTGTTWYDLSGNSNHGTLTNGPTYNSGDGGSIVFDGVNDYVPLPDNITNLSGDWSIDVWIKPNNDSNPRVVTLLTDLDNLQVGYMNNTLVPYIRIDNSTISSTTSLIASEWVNIIYQISSSTRQIYINSILTSTVSGGITSNGLYSAIGGGYDGYQMNGNISKGLVYNRALSSTEIETNYNALKGRYGL